MIDKCRMQDISWFDGFLGKSNTPFTLNLNVYGWVGRLSALFLNYVFIYFIKQQLQHLWLLLDSLDSPLDRNHWII